MSTAEMPSVPRDCATEALANYENALSLCPDNHEARWNKGLARAVPGPISRGLEELRIAMGEGDGALEAQFRSTIVAGRRAACGSHDSPARRAGVGRHAPVRSLCPDGRTTWRQGAAGGAAAAPAPAVRYRRGLGRLRPRRKAARIRSALPADEPAARLRHRVELHPCGDSLHRRLRRSGFEVARAYGRKAGAADRHCLGGQRRAQEQQQALNRAGTVRATLEDAGSGVREHPEGVDPVGCGRARSIMRACCMSVGSWATLPTRPP